MATRREAIKKTFSRRSVSRSLLVSLVIGTALNAINQGDALISGEPLVMWKFLLTYTVPFAVSSYGSYGALRGT